MGHKADWCARWTWSALGLAASLTLWYAAWAQAVPKPASDLQQTVVRAMAGRNGTAVVLDLASGKVLAAYHPETAARRLAPPGSSIKPFTLLALLESGKVDAQATLLCKRPLTIGGHRLDCTHPDVQQPFDPATALAYSCNSYFTSVALRLTPADVTQCLSKARIGRGERIGAKRGHGPRGACRNPGATATGSDR